MENKNNKLKLITRFLVIGFVLFSMYVTILPPKDESIWLVFAYPIGILIWLVVAIISIFSLVGLFTFSLSRLLGWAFNRDYFD